jgi:pimeloyl-ACP methyl ester carboxylesterase
MTQSAGIASIPEVTHHRATLNGADLHYVIAGAEGTPILLVHGFPETWWAFHKLIPQLAADHRVIAVDLPGFGDSAHDPGDYTSSSAADVTHGGTWHIGVLAAPGIPEMLLAGREREFLAGYAYPAMSVTEGAITAQDIDEFTRAYSRPDGFRGATGLYRSMLHEGEDIKDLVAHEQLTMPVLAVGAGTGQFTHRTMVQVAQNVTKAQLDGIGHLAAIEAPETLAQTLLNFYRTLDA